MNHDQSTDRARRRIVGLLGTVPILTIAGCGGSEEEQPAAPAGRSGADEPRATRPEPRAASETPEVAPEPPAAPADAPEPSPAVAQAPAGESDAGSGEAPARLAEDDPTAQALGYRHDAADVDLERFPQRAEPQAADHYCRSCALYQPGEDPQWGGCPIFAGKLVNADGWCSSYVARA